MNKVYLFQLILLFAFTKGNCQKSNLQIAIDFEKEINSVIRPQKYLKYSIKKDKKHYQFKEIAFLLIYEDSIVFQSFKIAKDDSIQVASKIIYEKTIINYINYYFENFNIYRPKCHNGEFWSDGLVLPPPNYKSTLVGYSKNQWNISSVEKEITSGKNIYNFSFKSKLLNFKCLQLFKNLKSRNLFNKLKRKIK
jgi:hypothetical protein